MKTLIGIFVGLISVSFGKIMNRNKDTIVYNRTCNILALSGGGSFGAVQAGIVEGLLDSHSMPASFDVLTGISAGGLNAGFLSYYTNITEAVKPLYNILTNLTTEDIYNNGVLHILSDWSIYNTAPLKNTLTTIIADKVPELGAPITLIGATNLNEEALDVWRFDTLIPDDRIDVLMSTSAIPFAFPPQHINDTIYVDGGVINNEMITQALGYVSCVSYNVWFVSASSHERHPDITGLLSYISSVTHVLLDTFDYQLAEFQNVKCPYPRGHINACFPTATELEQYSILDFDNGAVLWELGRGAYNCTRFDIC